MMNCQEEEDRTGIGDWKTQRKVREMALSQQKETEERICARKNNVK